jgi:hypothetical protein
MELVERRVVVDLDRVCAGGERLDVTHVRETQEDVVVVPDFGDEVGRGGEAILIEAAPRLPGRRKRTEEDREGGGDQQAFQQMPR